MRKTREQLRNERAEAVCREVRYQIAQYGGIADNNKLWILLDKWMRYSKKNRYERPL
jgi:hypothetical protein